MRSSLSHRYHWQLYVEADIAPQCHAIMIYCRVYVDYRRFWEKIAIKTDLNWYQTDLNCKVIKIDLNWCDILILKTKYRYRDIDMIFPRFWDLRYRYRYRYSKIWVKYHIISYFATLSMAMTWSCVVFDRSDQICESPVMMSGCCTYSYTEVSMDDEPSIPTYREWEVRWERSEIG